MGLKCVPYYHYYFSYAMHACIILHHTVRSSTVFLSGPFLVPFFFVFFFLQNSCNETLEALVSYVLPATLFVHIQASKGLVTFNQRLHSNSFQGVKAM